MAETATLPKELAKALMDTFTPEGLACIAANLTPNYSKTAEGQEAERQANWLSEAIVNLLGTAEYNDLAEICGY